MCKLLSIVIPTKDRYQYLKSCIQTLVDIKDDSLEIIVQDNTYNNEEILAFIETISSLNLKYFHSKEKVSMAENSNIAISYSTGKYVCFIGDDDSICEKLLEIARYAEQNDIESCNFYVARYNWPDMVYAGTPMSDMRYVKVGEGLMEEVNLENELKFVLKYGGYTITPYMPKVYHELVSRECLERIRKITGTYFPGPSPDMANAIAVCLTSKKHVMAHMHLMVSGFSYNSGGGEGARNQHFKKIEDVSWLPKDISEKWCSDIPYIFSAETIWAQSVIESLKAMKADAYIKKLRIGYIYARFLFEHKDQSKILFEFCIKKPVRLFWLIHGVSQIALDKMKRSWKKIKTGSYGLPQYLEVNNIRSLEEACKHANIRNRGINIQT